jgi:hypothetical protein
MGGKLIQLKKATIINRKFIMEWVFYYVFIIIKLLNDDYSPEENNYKIVNNDRIVKLWLVITLIFVWFSSFGFF